MLLQFSVTNFKTFRKKATLSLIASNYDKIRESDNIHYDSKFNLKLLKSAVVYGANASGKSKLFEALIFMKHFVVTSSIKGQKGDKIDVEPFKLNSASEKATSEFEVTFTHDDIMYRYGFEVNNKKVLAEWLYYRPNTTEIELFYRDGVDFTTHKRNFTKGNTVIREGLVRDNALLLSVSAQFNDEISNKVLSWFKDLKTISGLYKKGYQGYSMRRINNPLLEAKTLELLNIADLGILDLKLQKLDQKKLPRRLSDEDREQIIEAASKATSRESELFSDVLTSHRRFKPNTEEIDPALFSLEDDESDGTKKFFALTAPILDVIEKGIPPFC